MYNNQDNTSIAETTASGGSSPEHAAQSTTADTKDGETTSQSSKKGDTARRIETILGQRNEARKEADSERAKREALERELAAVRGETYTPAEQSPADIGKAVATEFIKIEERKKAEEADKAEFEHLFETNPDATELLSEMEAIQKRNPNLSAKALYILAREERGISSNTTPVQSKSLQGRESGQVTSTSPSSIDSVEDLEAVQSLSPQERNAVLEKKILEEEL